MHPQHPKPPLNPSSNSLTRVIELPAQDASRSTWHDVISETFLWYRDLGSSKKSLVISSYSDNVLTLNDLQNFGTVVRRLLEPASDTIEDIRLFLSEQLFWTIYPLFTTLPFSNLHTFGVSFYKFKEMPNQPDYLSSITDAFGTIHLANPPTTVRDLNLRDYFSGFLLPSVPDEIRSSMPWGSLTHLSIQEGANYCNELFRALACCTNLKHCRLLLPGWNEDDQMIPPTQIYLAHLTHLEVEVQSHPSMVPLLDALMLPSLTSIRLSVHPGCGTLGSCHAEALLALHSRRMFSLEKFVASGIEWDADELTKYLHRCPTLKCLVLYGCSCDWESLLELLTYGDDWRAVPRLQTLEFSSDVLFNRDDHLGQLTNLYLSRQELRMDPLLSGVGGPRGIRIVLKNECRIEPDESWVLDALREIGIPVEFVTPSEHNIPPLSLDDLVL
ncbi:hypothetical protein BDN72DRAFT_959368 [Pluteus cervinus]|uniref:Uncharacterized protein n=1 Tax=Pluteus cervinus TaxID=181527 RepID=A0ACD3AVA6_9AGAR|nr:hypothetical protein BDN72DRAFT_959368 [Pluteus cervinus]